VRFFLSSANLSVFFQESASNTSFGCELKSLSNFIKLYISIFAMNRLIVQLVRSSRVIPHLNASYAPKRFIFSAISNFFGVSNNDAASERDLKIALAKDMRDAVKELSQGAHNAIPENKRPQLFSSNDLRKWDNENVNSLSIEQLIELARVNWEGNFNDDLSTQPNRSRSVFLWKHIISIDENNKEAIYSLAACYRSGEGIEKDSIQAFHMMKKLADEYKYPLALYAVALMYMNKEGISSTNTTPGPIITTSSNDDNDKQAFKYFHKAALGGVQPALNNLGNFLASGRGVKQDLQMAIKYYEGAVEVGDPVAKFTLGTWIAAGRGGLKQDYKKAFDLQCEAAQAGHAGAMYNTACFLMTGKGCDGVDYKLAAEWFQLAADKGNIPEACINLGHMYRHGHGVEKDLIKARNLYARHSMVHQDSKQMLHDIEAEIKGNRK
jgi:TPR repeat protein